MKKFISLFMSLVMLCSITAGLELTSYASTSTSGSCGTNAKYTYNSSTGELKISGSGTMKDYSAYTDVPWDSITESVKTITIEDGITKIGSWAFYYCINATKLTIPDGVLTINSYAFAACASLTSITIPDSVTYIGDYSFIMCTGLSNITIPDSVKTIGYGAFANCSGLKSVTFGSGISTIYNGAFDSTALTDVYYAGSESDWKKVSIGSPNNTELTSAKFHYNYKVSTSDTSSSSTSSDSSSSSSTTKTAKPKATSFKKLTVYNKSVKITWKKVSGANGYQIQYASNKSFTKNKKSKTVKGAKNNSLKIKKSSLKVTANMTYYVRIRTYKTVNGKKVYSSWSAVKKVSINK